MSGYRIFCRILQENIHPRYKDNQKTVVSWFLCFGFCWESDDLLLLLFPWEWWYCTSILPVLFNRGLFFKILQFPFSPVSFWMFLASLIWVLLSLAVSNMSPTWTNLNWYQWKIMTAIQIYLLCPLQNYVISYYLIVALFQIWFHLL